MRDERCKTLYAMIVAYKRTNDGNSPTFPELIEMTDISTKSLVSYHLQHLEEDGLIRRPPYLSRSIEVVGAEWFPAVTMEAFRTALKLARRALQDHDLESLDSALTALKGVLKQR